MQELLLRKSPAEGIEVWTLNRPEAMNSFNTGLLAALGEALKKANGDNRLRCLILTGSGGGLKKEAFSAGADLRERRAMSPEAVSLRVVQIRRTFSAIEQLRVPVIAAINGYALGGGLELALACDIRIASSRAVMGLTETSLAIIPGGGGTQRLPRIVGIAKAKELIFTARRIDAVTALSIGLVNQVCEPEKLMETALQMAGEIAQNGPIAVAQAKYAIHHGMNVALEAALELESEAYAKTIPTRDRLEALAAFAEKRKPVFYGR